MSPLQRPEPPAPDSREDRLSNGWALWEGGQEAVAASGAAQDDGPETHVHRAGWGTFVHEHPGGDGRHDHAPGDPAIAEEPGDEQ